MLHSLVDSARWLTLPPAEKKHEKKTKKVRYVLPVQQKCLSLQRQKGVLAHLARARHWQCRGERFESAMLHYKTAGYR